MHIVSEVSNAHAQNTLMLKKSHGWIAMHNCQVLDMTKETLS